MEKLKPPHVQAPKDHFGSQRPCSVSDTLRTIGHVGRPCYRSEPSACVRNSRSVTVSASKRRTRFRGPEARSCPLPIAVGFSRFGTSPILLTSKPLMGLSQLSYSWPLFFSGPRVGVSTRSHMSPCTSSLRWHALNEPDGTCTRIALRLWSEPRGGICARWHSPALIHRGLTKLREAFPGRPASVAGKNPSG